MKRILALALAIALAVICTACGSGDTAGTEAAKADTSSLELYGLRFTLPDELSDVHWRKAEGTEGVCNIRIGDSAFISMTASKKASVEDRAEQWTTIFENSEYTVEEYKSASTLSFDVYEFDQSAGFIFAVISLDGVTYDISRNLDESKEYGSDVFYKLLDSAEKITETAMPDDDGVLRGMSYTVPSSYEYGGYLYDSVEGIVSRDYYCSPNITGLVLSTFSESSSDANSIDLSGSVSIYGNTYYFSDDAEIPAGKRMTKDAIEEYLRGEYDDEDVETVMDELKKVDSCYILPYEELFCKHGGRYYRISMDDDDLSSYALDQFFSSISFS